MIAQLWCDEIIAGRRSYAEVPQKLKPQVRKLLIDAGRENLVVE